MILIPFVLSIAFALTGCAQEEASGGVTDVAGALFLSENETGAAAVTEEQGGTAAQSTGTASQGAPTAQGSSFSSAVSEVTEIEEAPDTAAAVEKARLLTEEECLSLESFLNEEGSCGFLLSIYGKPQDLDAEQVFRTGAGLAERNVSEEEMEAYLDETGEEEAPELMRLGAQKVSDLLQYKAGLSPEDLANAPDWVYLEEYDAYYKPYPEEDTNACSFEVTDAAVQGDYYRVHYRVRREDSGADGWHDPVYETILKKNGDGYRFCANRLWIEKDLLLRPFCSVEIEPYGEVYLCAYEPDEGSPEDADVTFALVKPEEVVTVLPGMTEQNLRPGMTFEDVVAVDTGDYDGDGIKEIMAICRYKTAKNARTSKDSKQEDGKGDAARDEGAALREDGLEARIYRWAAADGESGADAEFNTGDDEDLRADEALGDDEESGADEVPGTDEADEEPGDDEEPGADEEPGDDEEQVSKRKLVLDTELSARINRDVKSLSITGISEYIRTGKDRGPFASREEAYAAEIEAARDMGYDRFALIYVNEDREPELLEMGSTPDKGVKIIFYNSGELEETKVSSIFSYLKKANLLYSKSGTQNVFDEALYVYGRGSFDVYLSGTYGALDAAETAYSQDGKPQYLYTWEGSYVSEAGYQDALGFVYNRQKAVDASKIETLSAEEMLEELKKQ